MTPWVMTQRWSDLLFLHYEVSAEKLRTLVPPSLTLDTHNQRAWVSITPFWLSQLRPPGIPSLPWVSHFGEVNLRTYVTYQGKPGVYFFPGRQSSVGGVGSAHLLSSAVLARGDEHQGTWLRETALPKQALAWAQTGRVAPGVWTRSR